MNIHFISGLPRSGSNVFTAVLSQNPIFRAGITNPLAPLVNSVLSEMSYKYVTSLQFTDEQREDILHGLFSSYYASLGDFTFFNKHRLWTSKMSLLGRLFPSSKVIACVRQVPWIFDSCERLMSKNPIHPSGMFGFDPRTTVYERFDRWRSADGLVGVGLNGLKQAFYGDECQRLMLLRYETMVADPKTTMRLVYGFLGLPEYNHDFSNLSSSAPATDEWLGTPGLHTVRPVLELEKRDTILPPDLWRRAIPDTFWEKDNPRGVLVV